MFMNFTSSGTSHSTVNTRLSLSILINAHNYVLMAILILAKSKMPKQILCGKF